MDRLSGHARAGRSHRGRTRHPGTTVTGLRRVDWIRLVFDRDEVHAEAVGVGHRLPATCRIPMSTAAALIAEGTPSIAQRVDHRLAGSPGSPADGSGSER